MIATQERDGVQALYRFECAGCRRYHEELSHPNEFQRHADSWAYKHSLPTCEVSYVKLWHKIPRGFDERSLIKRAMHRLGAAFSDWMLPWYLRSWEFKPNANFQLSFNASSNLTITSLNSLASDTNLVAGASSAVVDNGASATLLDLVISGFIKAGTSPTASQAIYAYAWTTVDDTPTYPDTVSGSDAAISITSANVRDGFMRPFWGQTIDSTTNRIYYTGGNSLNDVFGGAVRKYGVWCVHNTGVALAASGHQFTVKQSYISG